MNSRNFGGICSAMARSAMRMGSSSSRSARAMSALMAYLAFFESIRLLPPLRGKRDFTPLQRAPASAGLCRNHNAEALTQQVVVTTCCLGVPPGRETSTCPGLAGRSKSEKSGPTIAEALEVVRIRCWDMHNKCGTGLNDSGGIRLGTEAHRQCRIVQGVRDDDCRVNGSGVLRVRIAYIVTRADRIGGVQVHVRDLAESAQAQGHSPTVI